MSVATSNVIGLFHLDTSADFPFTGEANTDLQRDLARIARFGGGGDIIATRPGLIRMPQVTGQPGRTDWPMVSVDVVRLTASLTVEWKRLLTRFGNRP